MIDLRPKVCSSCNGRMIKERGKLRHGINLKFRCINRSCRNSSSILTGTVFERSHSTVAKIIRAIYCYAAKDTIEEASHECI